MNITSSIFRENDIRGTYPEQINENTIKLYQDGIFVGKTEKFKRLHFYRKEPKFYLFCL